MIVLEQITKRFRERPAVDQICIEIAAKSSVAILGPSGSGKTTLLRLIAGLDLPDEGCIYLAGKLVSRPAWGVAPHLRGMGFVFQTAALWPHMTVAQNILFGLGRLPRKEARLRLEKVLCQTSLTELASRYPHQLSGGEARRTALARSLAPEPACLLLDEPLVNLHRESKEELLVLIRDSLRTNGATLLYVSHDKSEAAALCERILLLEHGRLVNDRLVDNDTSAIGGGHQ